MSIETISFNGKEYPKFQAEGFASKFAFPFALEVCHGTGLDIGCNREEWKLPRAIAIDPEITPGYHANQFPYDKLNYIFSSHCLEHIPNWVETLDYWHSKLLPTGIVFLYLPDHSQKYWRPYFNRKHIHSFTPEIIGAYFKDQPLMWKNVFVSGVDLNNSFMAIAEKV